MVVSGSQDGLMRLSRVAESYYHLVTNVSPKQKSLFGVSTIESMSHLQFQSSNVAPDYIKQHDLRPASDSETN